MGDKDLKFLTSTSLMNETSFNADGKLSGSSFRVGSNIVNSKYGTFNTKLMLNTDGDMKFSNYQARGTIISPDLKLASTDKTTLSGCLENWTTLKLDENFKKQDISNSFRPKLKLKVKDAPIIGNFQAYSAVKFDCSQKNTDLKFKGGLLGIQKTFGRVSTWAEYHVPPEGIHSPAKASFVAGLGVKLWK